MDFRTPKNCSKQQFITVCVKCHKIFAKEILLVSQICHQGVTCDANNIHDLKHKQLNSSRGEFVSLEWYKAGKALNLTLCIIIFVLTQESEQLAVKSSRKYLSLVQL